MSDARPIRPVPSVRLPPVRPRRGSRAAAGSLIATGALLAACGSSTSPSTTTTTKPVITTTTTTLGPAELAALDPKLLSAGDFPAGWARDTDPNAASIKGTPACLADVVLAKGSASRVTAVFAGPKGPPPAAIQTVATFAPGQAARSAKALRTGFGLCNGGTLSLNGQSAQLGVRTIPIASTGDAGFAAQMVIAAASVHSYLDVFYGVRGDVASALIWRSTSPSTNDFDRTAAQALAKL
jgi:hypothetical protein